MSTIRRRSIPPSPRFRGLGMAAAVIAIACASTGITRADDHTSAPEKGSLAVFAADLQAADRNLGDFEAVYIYSITKVVVPYAEGTTAGATRREEGHLTVRRRGADVFLDYATAMPASGPNATSGPGTVIHQRYFIEDGRFVARMDESILTLNPRSMPAFQALPPFDADLRYVFYPDGLASASQCREARAEVAHQLRLDASKPHVEEFVTDRPLEGALGVGLQGHRLRFDPQDGRIAEEVQGLFLRLADGRELLYPFSRYEVTAREGDWASALRYEVFDSRLLFSDPDVTGLPEFDRLMAIRNAHPSTTVEFRLQSMGALSAEAPVLVDDVVAEVRGVRRSENAGVEYTERKDPSTRKWTKALVFDPGTRTWGPPA